MKDSGSGSGRIRVSVVVPVYQAMPYLKALLLSLMDQDLTPEQYEVIAVDDGSTDEGPELLDDLARRNPQLRVVHQENSGWPGIPRNRGLDLARGTYVFFADADDEVGPEALRRMADFADEHGSDVLVPKMVGRGGRWVRSSIYSRTEVDADLEKVFQTLTPQKLFRRSLLLENGIRFPEEKVRLEDGILLAQAYLKARRVSVYADYDCYFLMAREDGQNISSQRFDPAGYTWSVAEISRLVRENDPDRARADRVILDLFRRKCLKFYQPNRYLRMSEERRGAFLAAHREFVRAWIPVALASELDEKNRECTELIRSGDGAGLVARAQPHLVEALAGVFLLGGQWHRHGALEISLEVQGAWSGGRPQPLSLEVRRRDGEVVQEVPLSEGGPGHRDVGGRRIQRKVAVLEPSVVKGPAGSVLDLRVVVDGSAERVRVAAPLLWLVPEARGKVRPYATVQGNFSIETQ